MMRVMKKAPAFLPAMLFALMMVFVMMPLTAETVHAEVYNLWVGETRVTSENLSGSGWSYDPYTFTLTLENARIEDIYSKDINLTIKVKDTNTIGTGDVPRGINAENGSLTIEGSGTLNVKGESSAIIASGEVIISGGTVDAMVQGFACNAIYSDISVVISGGTVVAAASGVGDCCAIFANNDVKVVGGVVTATATAEDGEAFGIYSMSQIEIASGAVLTSTGTSAALGGSVLCGTYGTGWTDVEGTGEGTDFTDELCNIDVDLSGYKKVRFPLVKRTVAFKVVNGSWNDETAADKSVTLRGYGSDVLKLSDGDIPAVGGEPEDGYEAGSWDVTPSTETAIEGNTTYKYTYAPKDYTVTVNNGSGSGVYTKGETVTITANDPEEGKRFREWDGAEGLTFTEGSATTAAATFTMPAKDVTVIAVYEDIPAPPEPIKVSIPTGKTLTYNGKTQTGVAAGTGYTLSGMTSAANAGSYQAKAALKEGYVWNDGTAAAKSISWKINKATAKVTAPAGKTLTYNGKTQTGVAAGANYTLTGTVKAANAGTYTAKAALKTNANYTYKWTDGTAAAKTISWKINKATKKVTAPAGKTLTYNGKTQTGVATGANYTLSGTVKAAKAGSYTAKAALKTNANYTYKWTDGTVAARTVKWKINKAANTFSIKARTATVKYSAVKKKAQVLGVTSVITFTNSGQGARTFVKLSGNKKITVAGTTGQVTVQKKLKKGTYQVKVKVRANGSANYNASAWKTVTFTVRVK